jgi:Fe-S cluster assembly protein SufD
MMIMATMTNHSPVKQTDPYLEAFSRFEQEAPGKQPTWLFPIRKAGIARFAELGFPTLKDEDWRFTNIAPIVQRPFHPIHDYSLDGLNLGVVRQFAFRDLDSYRLVFVNGHFSPELSEVNALPKGVRVASLAAELTENPAAVEKHLSRHTRTDENAFAALNTAFFHDGAFLQVPSGVTLEKPVHLLYITTASEPGATVHPRNLIIAGQGSGLTVIESYVSTVRAAYFTNALTEFVIGEGAHVEHCKLQDESPAAFHIATLHSFLGRSCNFLSHSIALGSKLSRNTIRTQLAGEGVECVLNGLYLTRDEQLADHHMVVEHAEPHCNSHEYFNGILDDRSRGVFHGRILVRPGAQKTDAKQTNKNLLLSDDATANTKPQLEIYADDVKCTHGATIGQLQKEAIFYLRARGIGEETARRMLIHSFAGEITDRIQCVPVRDELDQLVWDRLEENEHISVQSRLAPEPVQV